MDDDDEIHSHHSPASGSPASSPIANGRITVTVAAPAPQQQPLPANSLALALPIQQQPARGNNNGGGGGGREDCWSEAATAVLIEAWGERYLELSRGNLKQKHWKEVAEIVSVREDYTKTPKTDIQCKNRIDTVKKKYKSEKAKIAAGGPPSKWPFFERLDSLIGPTAKIPGSGAAETNTAGNSNFLLQKLPLAVPVVGIRSTTTNHFQPKQHQQQFPLKNQKIQIRRRPPAESDSSEREAASPVSSESFPPECFERKRPRHQREMNSNAVKGRERGKGKGWGCAVRELTHAIVKFGEAYEQAESSKLQQVVEMEKQRMKFAKDLELQRMQFFMKTQLEISQLKLGGKKGGGNTSNRHNNNNSNNDNNHNNNSDSQ